MDEAKTKKWKAGDRLVFKSRTNFDQYHGWYSLSDPICIVDKHDESSPQYVHVIFTNKWDRPVQLCFHEDVFTEAPSAIAWYAMPIFSDPMSY